MIGIFITAKVFIECYRGCFHKKWKIFEFPIFSKNPICHLPSGHYHNDQLHSVTSGLWVLACARRAHLST